jgi:predicted RNA-binding protein with PUA domain
MKIVICASLDFTPKVKEVANQLSEQGHKITIPKTSEMILNGEVTLEQIIKEKENGKISKRVIKQNSFKYYFEKIKEADAILVLNFKKKDIEGYIGRSTFLEMGFAHVLGKKIFLLNKIPDMNYRDEISAMEPVILEGNLSRI